MTRAFKGRLPDWTFYAASKLLSVWVMFAKFNGLVPSRRLEVGKKKSKADRHPQWHE